jgi:hypothetical protein
MSLKRALLLLGTETYFKDEYTDISKKCIDEMRRGHLSCVIEGDISDVVKWRLIGEGIKVKFQSIESKCNSSWDYLNHTCSDKCGIQSYQLSWHP